MASDKEDVKETEVSWRVAEFEHREKEASWYWIVGTIGAVLAMLALWQKNFFFFIFILFAEVMVLTGARKKPKIVEFRITEKGVGIGGAIFYPFSELEWFDIKNRPGRLDLIIMKRKTAINPLVHMLADTDTAKEVERFLTGKLTRFDYDESLVSILMDWFGF